jgi:hypothetical protein
VPWCEVVQNAELFVQTVDRVFGLHESSLANEYESSVSKDDGKVSEPVVAVSEIQRQGVKLEPISLEEIRRQARENWLRLRQQNIGAAKQVGQSKDVERGAEEEQSHLSDDDVGE